MVKHRLVFLLLYHIAGKLGGEFDKLCVTCRTEAIIT